MKETKESLISLYGDRATMILDMANQSNNFELISLDLPYLKVEIEYAIRFEYVKKPIDFLARRVGLCFIDKKSSLLCLESVCDEMARILSWSDEEKESIKKESEEFINKNF